MVDIESTEVFLPINRETLNTVNTNIGGAVEEAVDAADCVYCVVMTIQTLDCMALAINFLVNQGVTLDVILLDTPDEDAALH